MKTFIQSLPAALLALVLIPSLAYADPNFLCPHVNGSYFVDVKEHSVVYTIVNASGVEDAQGELPCEGPMESAFVCSGKARELDGRTFKFTGPAHNAEVVIPESALVARAGTFQINGELIRCSEKK